MSATWSVKWPYKNVRMHSQAKFEDLAQRTLDPETKLLDTAGQEQDLG